MVLYDKDVQYLHAEYVTKICMNRLFVVLCSHLMGGFFLFFFYFFIVVIHSGFYFGKCNTPRARNHAK